MAWFQGRGHSVTGIDRDLASAKAAQCPGTLICADIEANPWPLITETHPTQFGAVVVTNYLWRALMPTILESVQPGGLLLYETFAAGNETVGRPSRADFLLLPCELLALCSGWHIVAYENGTLEAPPRFVQRIATIKPLPGSDMEPAQNRYPL